MFADRHNKSQDWPGSREAATLAADFNDNPTECHHAPYNLLQPHCRRRRALPR